MRPAVFYLEQLLVVDDVGETDEENDGQEK